MLPYLALMALLVLVSVSAVDRISVANGTQSGNLIAYGQAPTAPLNNNSTNKTNGRIFAINEAGEHGNLLFNVSQNNPVAVQLTSIGIMLYVNTSQAGSATLDFVFSNATSTTPAPPNGLTKVMAVNITVNTSANVITHMALRYNCSIPSTDVAPFILKNNAWNKVTPFTVNTTNCFVNFTVPNDPILALMTYSAVSQAPSNTATNTTKQTNSTQSTQQEGNGASALGIAVGIAIVILVIAVVAVILSKMKKHH